MAQYIGYLTGARGGQLHRLGNKSSGILVEANAWNIGAKVTIRWDEELKDDVLEVFVTGGSNGVIEQRRIYKLEGKRLPFSHRRRLDEPAQQTTG